MMRDPCINAQHARSKWTRCAEQASPTTHTQHVLLASAKFVQPDNGTDNTETHKGTHRAAAWPLARCAARTGTSKAPSEQHTARNTKYSHNKQHEHNNKQRVATSIWSGTRAHHGGEGRHHVAHVDRFPSTDGAGTSSSQPQQDGQNMITSKKTHNSKDLETSTPGSMSRTSAAAQPGVPTQKGFKRNWKIGPMFTR